MDLRDPTIFPPRPGRPVSCQSIAWLPRHMREVQSLSILPVCFTAHDCGHTCPATRYVLRAHLTHTRCFQAEFSNLDELVTWLSTFPRPALSI